MVLLNYLISLDKVFIFIRMKIIYWSWKFLCFSILYDIFFMFKRIFISFIEFMNKVSISVIVNFYVVNVVKMIDNDFYYVFRKKRIIFVC